MSRREEFMANLGFATGGLIFWFLTSDLNMTVWWHFILWFFGMSLSALLFGAACAILAHFFN